MVYHRSVVLPFCLALPICLDIFSFNQLTEKVRRSILVSRQVVSTRFYNKLIFKTGQLKHQDQPNQETFKGLLRKFFIPVKRKYRSSHRRFLKKEFFKNFKKFLGKPLRWSLIFNKMIKRLQNRCFPVNFACEFCEFFQNIFFTEHLQATFKIKMRNIFCASLRPNQTSVMELIAKITNG